MHFVSCLSLACVLCLFQKIVSWFCLYSLFIGWCVFACSVVTADSAVLPFSLPSGCSLKEVDRFGHHSYYQLFYDGIPVSHAQMVWSSRSGWVFGRWPWCVIDCTCVFPDWTWQDDGKDFYVFDQLKSYGDVQLQEKMWIGREDGRWVPGLSFVIHKDGCVLQRGVWNVWDRCVHELFEERCRLLQKEGFVRIYPHNFVVTPQKEEVFLKSLLVKDRFSVCVMNGTRVVVLNCQQDGPGFDEKKCVHRLVGNCGKQCDFGEPDYNSPKYDEAIAYHAIHRAMQWHQNMSGQARFFDSWSQPLLVYVNHPVPDNAPPDLVQYEASSHPSYAGIIRIGQRFGGHNGSQLKGLGKDLDVYFHEFSHKIYRTSAFLLEWFCA